MKQLTVLFFSVVILTACNEVGSGEKKEMNTPPTGKDVLTDTVNFTTIEWLDSTHQDLGKLKQGQAIEIVYNFRNSGDKPLVVKTDAECGCTVAESPEAPIAPGESAKIRGRFDSKGQGISKHTKGIRFSSNTKHYNNTRLTFSVEVTD